MDFLFADCSPAMDSRMERHEAMKLCHELALFRHNSPAMDCKFISGSDMSLALKFP